MTKAQLFKTAKQLSESCGNTPEYYLELLIESLVEIERARLLRLVGILK